MGFNFFDGLFDFDGNGRVDEIDAFFGSMILDKHSGSFGSDEYDPEEDENSDEFDPFDAQDFTSTEEFYEEHSGDFTDFDDANDYFNDWN